MLKILLQSWHDSLNLIIIAMLKELTPCFTHLLQKLGSRWPFLVQDIPWELALQFHQIVVLGVLNEVLILITFWLQAMDEALDKTAQQDKKKELKYWIISKIFTKNFSILILLMVSSFIKCNRTKILKIWTSNNSNWYFV